MIHFYKEVLKFQMFYRFNMNLFLFYFNFFILFKTRIPPKLQCRFSKKNLKKQKCKKRQKKTKTTNRRMHNLISRNISISHFTIGEKET